MINDSIKKISDRKLSKLSNHRLKEHLINKEFTGVIEPELIGIPPFMVENQQENLLQIMILMNLCL